MSVNKCRGQGYDRASAMSGAYSGVQKRITDREPSTEPINLGTGRKSLNIYGNVAS